MNYYNKEAYLNIWDTYPFYLKSWNFLSKSRKEMEQANLKFVPRTNTLLQKTILNTKNLKSFSLTKHCKDMFIQVKDLAFFNFTACWWTITDQTTEEHQVENSTAEAEAEAEA